MTLSRARRRLVERLRSSRTRVREGAFLVEGVRSADEALEAGAGVRLALLSPRLDTLEGGPALRARVRAAGVEAIEVADAELEEVSDTETPQGILLVCEEPPSELARIEPGPQASLVVVDAVQDPGNLGTLLRSARAFAVSAVVALDGTVDPWNPKVVRAAAGAAFRVPVARASWGEASAWLDEHGVELVGAAMDGEDVRDVRPSPRWALAVGNEGAGLRPEVAARADPVRVPMPGGGESLNVGVAASILLFELTGHG